MSKLRLIVPLMMLTFFAAKSFAGVLLEPYVGYVYGTLDITASNTKLEYKDTGPVFGGRIGYIFSGAMIGAEYSRSILTTSLEKPAAQAATTADDDSIVSNMSAFVGFKLPALFRFWVSYIFDSKYEDDKNPGLGDEFLGSGYKLGVGISPLPLLSINLEYKALAYDEFTDAASGTTTTLSGDNELKSKQIVLSVSLPFEL